MQALEAMGKGQESGFFEFANRGLMYELNGKVSEALVFYKEAHKSIEIDPNLQSLQEPEKRGWENRKQKMQSHIDRVQKKINS